MLRGLWKRLRSAAGVGRFSRRVKVAGLLLAAVFFANLFAFMGRDSLEKKLQYELNNRAFALASIARHAAKTHDGETAAFWTAYARLERLNEKRYAPIAEKYGLQANGWVVAAKVHSAGIAFAMFPAKVIAVMADATEEYVAELEALRALAPTEDKAFFDYVVEQEMAQAAALRHVVDGRYDLAAAVLNACTDRYQ